MLTCVLCHCLGIEIDDAIEIAENIDGEFVPDEILALSVALTPP